jgi:carbonic anhydrase
MNLNTNQHTMKKIITALCVVGLLSSASLFANHHGHNHAMMMAPGAVQSAASQSAMTPAEGLQRLKDGNSRFVKGLSTSRDYLEQATATASGQYPFAIILGCVDSRVPVEVVFDQGIGDVFSARVAGNIAPSDVIGSMEFATAAAGSKVILVVGHTACGAVKGAIDDVKLGSLTGLLDQIQPAVKSTALMSGETKTSKNAAYVDRVASSNVKATMARILATSPTIAGMVKEGKVVLAGGMYDLQTGQVVFMD